MPTFSHLEISFQPIVKQLDFISFFLFIRRLYRLTFFIHYKILNTFDYLFILLLQSTTVLAFHFKKLLFAAEFIVFLNGVSQITTKLGPLIITHILSSFLSPSLFFFHSVSFSV